MSYPVHLKLETAEGYLMVNQNQVCFADGGVQSWRKQVFPNQNWEHTEKIPPKSKARHAWMNGTPLGRCTITKVCAEGGHWEIVIRRDDVI